jgi:hypothetical protein
MRAVGKPGSAVRARINDVLEGTYTFGIWNEPDDSRQPEDRSSDHHLEIRGGLGEVLRSVATDGGLRLLAAQFPQNTLQGVDPLLLSRPKSGLRHLFWQTNRRLVDSLLARLLVPG